MSAGEEGSLYPAFYRMEARGWLSSEWGLTDTARRPLTRPGRGGGQLEAERQAGRLTARPERALQLRSHANPAACSYITRWSGGMSSPEKSREMFHLQMRAEEYERRD